MGPYLLRSTLAHLVLISLAVWLPTLHRNQPVIWLDGFDYMGSGGGGGGDKTTGGGIKDEHRGQVVPQPVPEKIPDKAGPVQRPTKGKETWKVKDAKEPIKTDSTQQTVTAPVERGEKDQKGQTNVIRRGVSNDAPEGEGGFDFGDGRGPGSGGGVGTGIGIGVGPGTGSGFGFGSYLTTLRKRIWGEWTQSAVFGTNLSCVVALTVHKDGFVSGVKLAKSSGDTHYDNVAQRAVRNSSPLPPLPSNFPTEKQEFRIQFRLIE